MVAAAVAATATAGPYASGMNTEKRKWAAGQAAQRRRQAAALRAERIPSGDWRRVRAKAATLSRLAAEAARFERMARVEDDGCGPF